LRGASVIWEFLRSFIPGLPESPHWTTGRTWLLRLGCFQLLEPKEQAADWIWLIDHTVQIGREKCLLILGIRARNLPADRPLQLADMVPILLSPATSVTKHQVAEELEAATQITGVPTAILSDHGADLRGGIELYRQQHPQTRELYDLKHKAACLLKHRLQNDPRFAEYSRQMGQCKFQTQQTELDFLVPPSGRSKARFMNLEKFIGWGQRTLAVLDREPASVQRHVSHERLEQKLGWLREHRTALDEWASWLSVIDTAQRAVRHGLSQTTARDLTAQLPQSSHGSTQQLQGELLAFVIQEAEHLKEGERLPLMTEVLESSFGRLKFLERDQQKRGFTALVLSLGAIVGTWTAERIEHALHKTPLKVVDQWMRTHFPQGTHHTKRRQAYADAAKPADTAKKIPEDP